jgi:hypothetical protein
MYLEPFSSMLNSALLKGSSLISFILLIGSFAVLVATIDKSLRDLIVGLRDNAILLAPLDDTQDTTGSSSQ